MKARVKKNIQLKIKEGMNKNEEHMRFIGKTLEKEYALILKFKSATQLQH